jgi:ACR3 family arsenite transporter
MILLGVAPCTAMVFVWSQLVKGDANYTLVQVSVNDLIMVVALCADCRLSAGGDQCRPCRGSTLLLSTVLYVVLPLLAGMATRQVIW